MALQTMEGHQRAILGTLTVEEIYQDRDSFAKLVLEVATPDMANMGLEIVSFTIRDIQDDQGYLEALGVARSDTYPSSHDAIAYGAPRIVRLDDQHALAVFWCTQGADTHVRWSKVRVD